jgi:hypothetical protein
MFLVLQIRHSHRRFQLPDCNQRLVLAKLRLELGATFNLGDYLLDVLRRNKLAPHKKTTYHRTHGGRCRWVAERPQTAVKAGQLAQDGRDFFVVVGATVRDQLEA